MVHTKLESFEDLQSSLLMLQEATEQLPECVELMRQLGFTEPFTDHRIRPEEEPISSENYRESIVSERCLSRHRAPLLVLQQC